MLIVTYFGNIFRWAIFWCCEVMLSQVHVTDDVVVTLSVLSWTEVPWFLLGIVRPIFKSDHLILKIYDVVGLFVSQSAILYVKEVRTENIRV